MRRSLTITCLLAASLAGLALALGSGGAEAATPLAVQDPKVLRLAERAVPWHPGSSFEVVEDERRQTPSGSYRMLSVQRSCANQFLSGTTTMVLDELAGVVWVGGRGVLPEAVAAVDPKNLRAHLETLVPELLKVNMNLKARLDWEGGERGAALIPFALRIDTGYGEYRKPAAVSADGRVLVLGAPYPFEQDPVALRRELLRTSSQVVWDHGREGAPVELVELSDFECPGCRAKWPLVKQLFERFGGSVRHGFVAFPLTTIHPWAFRAASAGWCVAEQRPDLLLPLKELFYSLQQDMEVAEVTPTVRDYVAANRLDQARFDQCYLRPPSLAGVHDQMTLGNRLGVNATPTFFVNGYLVQMPEEAWLLPMVERLVAGQEP